MAAKKKKKAPRDLYSADEKRDNFQAIYILLARIGVIKKKEDLRTRYTDEGGNVSIAIPGIKMAIVFEGDDYEELQEKNWQITRINDLDLPSFARVLFNIETTARFASVYSKADPTIKKTSEPEEKIYREILRRMLPTPDRNYRFERENGSELTTPDFTWEEYKVVFFMDGAYWHSVKSDKEMISAIKRSRKVGSKIVDARKDKVRKDQEIRSELASRGWLVMGCTDADVEDEEGLKNVVDLIEKTINRIRDARKVLGSDRDKEDKDISLEKNSDQSDDGEDDMFDILLSDDDSEQEQLGGQEQAAEKQESDTNGSGTVDPVESLLSDDEDEDQEEEYEDEDELYLQYLEQERREALIEEEAISEDDSWIR